MASRSFSAQEIEKFISKQQTIASLQSELSAAQHALAESRAVAAVNRAGVTDSAVEERDRKCADLSKKIGRLQKSLADVTSHGSALEHEFALAQSENARLVIENVELKKKQGDLAGGAEKVIQRLTAQVAELKEVRSRLERFVAALQEENDRLKGEAEKWRENEFQSKSEIRRLIQENRIAVDQVAKAERQLQQMKVQQETTEARLAQFQSELSASEVVTKSERRQQALYAGELSKVQKVQDELERSLADARSAYDRLRDEKAHVELELDESRLANSKLSFSLQEHQRQKSEVEIKNEEFKSQIQFLRRELQSVRSATQKTADLESDIAKRRQEFDALKRKYAQLSDQHSAVTAELSELKSVALRERRDADTVRRQKEKAQRANEALAVATVKAVDGTRAVARHLGERCLTQIRAIQARYSAALGALNERIENLRRSIANLALLLQQKFFAPGGVSPERVRFLRQIESHLRLIDAITQQCASLVHFPRERVPPASDLVNHAGTAEAFLRQLAAVAQERRAMRP
jgi:DNA repair exonuclease SbcCD ATPase subunit